MADRREYHEAACWMCHEPAVWLVYEDRLDPQSEWLMTCQRHKHSAFS
jgi:hypothetical protein